MMSGVVAWAVAQASNVAWNAATVGVTGATAAGVLAREEVLRGVDADEDHASGIDVKRDVAGEERFAPTGNVECGVAGEDASVAVAVLAYKAMWAYAS